MTVPAIRGSGQFLWRRESREVEQLQGGVDLRAVCEEECFAHQLVQLDGEQRHERTWSLLKEV